jgi:manganese/zinc/iron transport system substrate-binding protein
MWKGNWPASSGGLGRALFGLCLATAVVLTGCSGGDGNGKKWTRGPVVVDRQHQGGYPIKAVCTTGMVADLVQRVGGDRVAVTALMGADVDPHTYKAATGDVARINGADVIFYSGLHLEGKMTDIFERSARKRPTFAVAEYLQESALRITGEAADPHVWFDVALWARVAEVVTQVLEKYDPTNAAEYRKRGQEYQEELTRLHAYAKEQIATIPKERRVLITSHDAFHYFGRAYDLEVRGIQGISTDAEASVKDINDLVDFIVSRKVKAVFVETSVNKRNMEALRQGCQARGHEVAIGGELFSDAMGPAGTATGNYVGMVRHNVDTIVGALK